MAIAAARAFGDDAIELCALDRSKLAALAAVVARPGALRGFAYVSVHAPAKEAVGHWPEVAAQLVALPARVETIVLHPDVTGRAELDLLRPLGGRLCFENMDCAKDDGRFPNELDRVFDACPDACFCLDVAHVATHDLSMGLGFDLVAHFGRRLRQVHLSGIEPDGTHRPTTAEDLARYAPVLAQIIDVPIVLEALLEP